MDMKRVAVICDTPTPSSVWDTVHVVNRSVMVVNQAEEKGYYVLRP